jgi:L-lactate dehydrogenase complex protein LldG
MNARDAIFAALEGHRYAVSASPPPPVYAPPTAAGDLFTRFAAQLEAAGGRARALEGPDVLALALRTDAPLRDARRVWSSLAGFPSRHPDGAPRTPHDLADLDVALLAGSVAVAESGAVWLAPRDPLERAAAFLAEHVILVVPRAALVADLHAAYARLDLAARPFGCFVCGPSKTADIEQALVIGAHGPRSLEVLVVGAG